ncbi:MAG: hypothetical protein JSV61_13010 [Anaerolineales bacterium]|nr:MAG: hypothetical protein JSV61_13010 [Anaerolineales bacterium]
MPASKTKLTWISISLAAAGLIAISVLLAFSSTRFESLQGWASFLGVSLLAAMLLLGGWWSVRGEAPPAWVFYLLVGAALLRLGVGLFWYLALPARGYDSPPEQAGYVMADAHERDQAAWELAASGKPLLSAFQGAYHRADQYGGFLYLSAAVYRYMGGQVHQPLLIVVLTAAFSSLVVLFTWGLAHRLWGERPAHLAAWGIALYPEALLLGSSQMREAFLMTLVMVAFWGALRAAHSRALQELGWVLAALLLCLPLSPPVTGLLLALLLIQALFMFDRRFLRKFISQPRNLLLLVLLAILILAATWLTLRQLAPEVGTNPLALLQWWFKKTADWQAHLSKRASGWIQKIFRSTPDWMDMPLLLGYGVVQPFLPAALGDISGAFLWRSIAIWRALGWTLLLPLLLYAPLRAWRENADRWHPARGLSLVVWLVILLASFRSGGDMWDNPRYRVIFVGLQVALAAWAWSAPRRAPDPWLRRVLVGLGLVLVWFMPWYLRRYTPLQWPVVDLFKTLGLGLASAILYWLWDWVGEWAKRGQA